MQDGRLRILHHPAAPVLNPIYVATRRGLQNRPLLEAVFEALLASGPG